MGAIVQCMIMLAMQIDRAIVLLCAHQTKSVAKQKWGYTHSRPKMINIYRELNYRIRTVSKLAKLHYNILQNMLY